MKFGVNKKILLYTAGCVWIFAGINILRIGIVTWLNDTHYWLFKIGEATIVFLLFFNLVFKRLFYKPVSYTHLSHPITFSLYSLTYLLYFKVICLFNNLDKEIVVPIKIVH